MLKLMLAPIVIIALIGCGSGPGVVSLQVNPGNAELLVGQTTRFTANVSGANDHEVDWGSTGGQLIAKDNSATFVALQAGSFEVSATSRSDPTITATATVLVTAPPGQAHVRIVTDGSVLLAGAGATTRIEAEIVDADGSVIDTGQVTWSSSDPATVSVVADGDRSALVTTQTAGTSQASITASFDGLTAAVSVLVTQPSAGTVLIASESVRAKTATSLTLKRDSVTETLAPGQRLVSGSAAGVLAEIVSVDVSVDEVSLTTTPTSLADAFDELSFAGEVTPLEVTVQLLEGRSAVVSTRSADGRLGATTVVDDVTCTSAGAAAPVDLTGSDITVTATIYGELAFSIFLGDDHFLAKFGTQLQVGASTGTVSFGGSPSGTVVCALELPRVGLAPLSATVMTLWTGFVPVLGVEVGATGAAASFSLSGPEGGLGAVLEGGIEYTEASGWLPLLHSEFDAEFEPFSASASFEQPFTARLAPFGRVDIGISFDLGVGDLATAVIDARFVELKGFGYLDFVLPSPVAVENKGYVGPEWSLGFGARGALKAEFEGALPDLLEYIGIDVNFAGQVELFEEQVERTPDQTAVRFRDGALSYRELERQAQSMAGHLQQNGVKAGDRVLLYMQNSPQFVVGFYAILRANAVVVPVNPMNRRAELEYLITDTEADVALCGLELLDNVTGLLEEGLLRHAVVGAYSEYVIGSPVAELPDAVKLPSNIPRLPGLVAWQDAMNAVDEPELHSAELRRHADELREHGVAPRRARRAWP